MSVHDRRLVQADGRIWKYLGELLNLSQPLSYQTCLSIFFLAIVSQTLRVRIESSLKGTGTGPLQLRELSDDVHHCLAAILYRRTAFEVTILASPVHSHPLCLCLTNLLPGQQWSQRRRCSLTKIYSTCSLRRPTTRPSCDWGHLHHQTKHLSWQ